MQFSPKIHSCVVEFLWKFFVFCQHIEKMCYLLSFSAKIKSEKVLKSLNDHEIEKKTSGRENLCPNFYKLQDLIFVDENNSKKPFVASWESMAKLL